MLILSSTKQLQASALVLPIIALSTSAKQFQSKSVQIISLRILQCFRQLCQRKQLGY